MRRCPRRGGRYRACQLASHFLFVCYLVWFTRGVKIGICYSEQFLLFGRQRNDYKTKKFQNAPSMVGGAGFFICSSFSSNVRLHCFANSQKYTSFPMLMISFKTKVAERPGFKSTRLAPTTVTPRLIFPASSSKPFTENGQVVYTGSSFASRCERVKWQNRSASSMDSKATT